MALPGLEGKVAIVTGSAGGIGAAVVALLREHGTVVEGFDLPEIDLRDLDALPGRVDAVATRHGRLDIVVHNAGVTHIGTVAETTLDQLEAVLLVNVKAPFVLTRAAIRYMQRTGGGSIVAIASDQALIGKPRSVAYGASKAAVAQMMRACALDHAADNIRCNAVAPGSTDTAMLRHVAAELQEHLGTDAWEAFRRAVPLRRIARPEEIAWAVAFLASDAGSFITGTVLPVDGGGVAQ